MSVGCVEPRPVLQPLPRPLVFDHRKEEPSPLPPPAPPPPVVTGQRIDGKTVVIDAGHGGKDPGAWRGTASKVPEKTLVLDVAKRLSSQLSGRGAKVVLTRSNDVFITLDQRAATADRSRADLFVSIHADSAKRLSASGVGIHIYTAASSQSQKAAFAMNAAFKRADIETRGIFRSNFHVLREHSRPAMLIECGFLTNSGDAARLNSETYRAKLAGAIAEGIAAYLGR